MNPLCDFWRVRAGRGEASRGSAYKMTTQDKGTRIDSLVLFLGNQCHGELGNDGSSAGPAKLTSRSIVLPPDIAHSNGMRQKRRNSSTRYEADFLTRNAESFAWCGKAWPLKNEIDSSAVNLAARAYALDDLLAGVASLRVTYVRFFQTSFVRDLFFAEVVPKPGHALR